MESRSRKWEDRIRDAGFKLVCDGEQEDAFFGGSVMRAFTIYGREDDEGRRAVVTHAVTFDNGRDLDVYFKAQSVTYDGDIRDLEQIAERKASADGKADEMRAAVATGAADIPE